MTTESVWIDVVVTAETDAAVLLNNGHRETWIPRSQILDSEDELRKAVATKVELPLWLAEKSGLV
ncbi:MAG: hypothetical protein Q8N51_00625 [Gammaproteobacteria bacterium]|nr:hypothetical protein [Gammaproteobacteria bacterium]